MAPPQKITIKPHCNVYVKTLPYKQPEVPFVTTQMYAQNNTSVSLFFTYFKYCLMFLKVIDREIVEPGHEKCR